MGIYDREYTRDDQPRGMRLSMPQSMVVTLILINAALFVADLFLNDWLKENLALRLSALHQPWLWWQFLTSAFVHGGVWHIGGNMLILFFFGRDIEAIYGKWELLKMYLSSAVVAALAWALFSKFVMYTPDVVVLGDGLTLPVMCLGASGAVSAVVMLMIVHFPSRQVLLYFAIPVPLWLLGVLWVAGDFLGSLSETNVAHSAHLAGFACGYIYYRWHIHLFSWLPTNFRFRRLKLPGRGPSLKVHDPEAYYRDLYAEADRILDKLHREGEGSLTAKERRILEDYSRHMRQKHR